MWIELHQSVVNHPKILALSALMGWGREETVGRMSVLWLWALDYAPTGHLLDVHRTSVIALAAGVESSRADQFIDALRSVTLLDADGRIHGWMEYAGKLLSVRKADAARKRKFRASGGRPVDVQPPSAVTVDRTGPDQTDHNQTTPAAPSALPADAGGNGRRTTKRPRTFLAPENQALFDRFYAVYPRKVARGAAEKAWAALAPDEALTGRMIASLDMQIRSSDWPNDPRFIPHPASWLRSRRWEDEVAAKPTAETWNMRG